MVAVSAGCSFHRGNQEQSAEDGVAVQDSHPHSEDVPENQARHWRGFASPDELKSLGRMSTAELKVFLDDKAQEPALRVEAIRLLMERTENREELFPVLLASMESLTIREREAALYYLSRFGRPVHIRQIRASLESSHDCLDHSKEGCGCYAHSVECTVQQILERAKESGEQDREE